VETTIKKDRLDVVPATRAISLLVPAIKKENQITGNRQVGNDLTNNPKKQINLLTETQVKAEFILSYHVAKLPSGSFVVYS
jgi:hypothetical protein